MRLKLCLVIAMIGGVKNSFADMGNAYLFKATVVASDTTLTGYFQAPYELLDDSTLSKFQSSDWYFKNRIVSDTQQDGLQISSYIYKYKFKTTQGETLFALSHSPNTFFLKKDKIKSIHYLDVVIFSTFGNAVISDIKEEDLPWVKTAPIKITRDMSDGCWELYFHFHENNAELDKLVKEYLSLQDGKNWKQKRRQQTPEKTKRFQGRHSWPQPVFLTTGIEHA